MMQRSRGGRRGRGRSRGPDFIFAVAGRDVEGTIWSVKKFGS